MTAVNRYLRRYKGGRWATDRDRRTEAQRDVDRVEYYCEYFHRLADKTQIISPSATRHVTHNRQTHARKVGQFASAIATNLLYRPQGVDRAARFGGIDPHVARAAGAAHDLGHPPFGHIGEQELDRWAVAHGLDGFEANAQSYRILTKLGAQPDVIQGMDVTFAVQTAVLKYPWTRGDRTGAGWGVYGSERRDFDLAQETLPPDRRGHPTLEAQIMDFADDMTFALHDFEDFFKLDSLQPALFDRPEYWTRSEEINEKLATKYPDQFKEGAFYRAASRVATYFKDDRSVQCLRSAPDDSITQDQAMRRFTSHWLTHWMEGVSIDDRGHLAIDSECWHEINVFKQLTWEEVIAKPALAVAQAGQRRLLVDLADLLYERQEHDGRPTVTLSRLSAIEGLCRADPDADLDDDQRRARAVVDYLAWLTEPQVVELHETLFGGRALQSYGTTWIR